MARTTGLRPYAKTRPEATRLANRRLILQAIFDDGPISRADLARATQLGKATVSDITSVLLGEGLVVESGRGTSTGGKPPTLIELDPDGRFAVAVDLSRRPFDAALLNLRGRISATRRGKSVQPTGREAVQEVHQLISDLVGVAGAPALGIGVAVPGAVSAKGVAVESARLGWSDLSLQDELEDVYGIPTYVVSDSEAAAVAEFGRGKSDPEADLLYVKIDERIAAAVVVGGEIHRATSRGGELTHVQVEDAAGLCTCGRTGCLSIVASVEAVLGPDFVDLSSDARKRLAAETSPRVDHAARALGEVLASSVAALDVERVVLGGTVSELPTVPELVAESMKRSLGWCPDVVASGLGDSAAVLGAGGMVLSGELGVVWV
jgi:predicted NBD/HSP70 family sugar kinase